MEPTVGQVRFGLKVIDVCAMTGDVVAQGNQLNFHGGDGKDWPIGGFLAKVAGLADGDRATLFWCTRGSKVSHYAAAFNYRTGKFAIAPQPFNFLLVPPLYNLWGVLAIFAGVFGLGGLLTGSLGAIPFLLGAVGFFAWIKSRQKKLRRAMEEALVQIRAAEGAPAVAPAAGGIRI